MKMFHYANIYETHVSQLLCRYFTKYVRMGPVAHGGPWNPGWAAGLWDHLPEQHCLLLYFPSLMNLIKRWNSELNILISTSTSIWYCFANKASSFQLWHGFDRAEETWAGHLPSPLEWLVWINRWGMFHGIGRCCSFFQLHLLCRWMQSISSQFYQPGASHDHCNESLCACLSLLSALICILLENKSKPFIKAVRIGEISASNARKKMKTDPRVECSL